MSEQPTAEQMKVSSKEELEQRIGMVEAAITKITSRKAEIVELMGEGETNFIDIMQDRLAKISDMRAKLAEAAGNEEETQKLIDRWNSHSHQKLEAIQATHQQIAQKFPGGLEAFKEKFGM